MEVLDEVLKSCSKVQCTKLSAKFRVFLKETLDEDQP